MFALKPKPISDEDMVKVEDLYKEWERRILFKRNGLEEKKHDQVCRDLPPGSWCKCRTRQQEIHEWEDWFIENYHLEPTDRHYEI